jgi:aldose 1-epimerase
MSIELITLRDEGAGTSAKVLAGFGFNCFSFQAVHAGRPVELLYSAPNFANEPGRGTGSGIPLLFPFPGRARGTRLEYGGRVFELPPGDEFGNAIHGFVFNRPWEILEQTPTRLVAWFQASQVDPGLLEHWPADFRIAAKYELRGNSLSSEFVIENPDDRPLPWGFGTHPYFRLPLSAETDAAERRTQAGRCRVTVPAREHWELVDMLPTGKRRPATGAYDIRGGLEFSATQLDDVFTALQFDRDTCTTTIGDPQSGAMLVMEFDKPFSTCVVFNPPHREAICIEPYTCVPGRFGEKGGIPLEQALSILPPGESARLRVRIELAEA